VLRGVPKLYVRKKEKNEEEDHHPSYIVKKKGRLNRRRVGGDSFVGQPSTRSEPVVRKGCQGKGILGRERKVGSPTSLGAGEPQQD